MFEELKYILIVIAMIYVFVAQIMAGVFFIEYCQQNSIIRSLFLGPIISEFKGLLWPIYL